jgi:choline dehydrogenase-like flavoprotein
MRTDYDLIVVGGGLGGAALAKAMAEQGVRGFCSRECGRVHLTPTTGF